MRKAVTEYLCSFPGCLSFANDMHHVTYNPARTEPFCRKHHIEITAINTNHHESAAMWGQARLSSEQRETIYMSWTYGLLKPIWNCTALLFTSEMLNYKAATPEVCKLNIHKGYWYCFKCKRTFPDLESGVAPYDFDHPPLDLEWYGKRWCSERGWVNMLD